MSSVYCAFGWHGVLRLRRDGKYYCSVCGKQVTPRPQSAKP
jgi:uncharacterized Zn finger protein (UPF0148 family)